MLPYKKLFVHITGGRETKFNKCDVSFFNFHSNSECEFILVSLCHTRQLN